MLVGERHRLRRVRRRGAVAIQHDERVAGGVVRHRLAHLAKLPLTAKWSAPPPERLTVSVPPLMAAKVPLTPTSSTCRLAASG